MAPPTRRSKAERALYYEDNTLPRTSDTVKVINLDAPAHIQDDHIKHETWKVICQDLARRELLSPSYIIPLTMLVDNLSLYHVYRTTLEEAGPLIPTFGKDGETVVGYKENPLFGMVKRTEKLICNLCEKFGLNPRDAIYVTNPDIKTVVSEQPKQDERKKITYFQ